MRSWERFSKTIFRLAADKYLRKIRENSFERVLRNSASMIDSLTLSEIKKFVRNKQTSSGGFADKGGNCDLYYSLFGYFIAEALEINDVMPSLKEYVKNVVQTSGLKGVYLKCAVILYAKLFGNETLPIDLQRKTFGGVQKKESRQETYSDFFNLLAYYYSEDYSGLIKVQKSIRTNITSTEMPCSLTAAHLILQYCFGKPVKELNDRLYSFYRNNGSFSAIKMAPVGDLLSTGVALYALRFINSDLRKIRPDCLNFIDSLYCDGGFCATTFDTDPDVEYTFYGLLALGALSN
jgi:hypothetical protein